MIRDATQQIAKMPEFSRRPRACCRYAWITTTFHGPASEHEVKRCSKLLGKRKQKLLARKMWTWEAGAGQPYLLSLFLQPIAALLHLLLRAQRGPCNPGVLQLVAHCFHRLSALSRHSPGLENF